MLGNTNSVRGWGFRGRRPKVQHSRSQQHKKQAQFCALRTFLQPSKMSGLPPPDYTVNEEGDRVIAASRRPDGTVRKERRVRAGYVPQDEQQVYVSRGAAVSNAPEAREGTAATAATAAGHYCLHLFGGYLPAGGVLASYKNLLWAQQWPQLATTMIGGWTPWVAVQAKCAQVPGF